jgi:hypothetical protein
MCFETNGLTFFFHLSVCRQLAGCRQELLCGSSWNLLPHTHVIIDATAIPAIQDNVVGLVTQLQAA